MIENMRERYPTLYRWIMYVCIAFVIGVFTGIGIATVVMR